MDLTEHTLATADGPMTVHEARRPDRDRAAVIVLQEAFGVNDHIQDIVSRFSEAGYHAVAPELFHRTGGGVVPYGEHSQILPHIAGLSDEGFLVDLDATIDHLAAAGWSPDQIAVVGFCIGGRVAFLLAAHRRVGAAVGFYGGGIVTPPEAFAAILPSLLPLADRLQTPWLGLFGDQDTTIPVADVERLEAALSGSSAAIVRYPDAGHAFHCDDRPGYLAAAANDGWSRTLAWLDTHLA